MTFFTKFAHVASDSFRFCVSSLTSFHNFLYSCYVIRLSSAAEAARFLLSFRSVKQYIGSGGQNGTFFARMTVRYLLPFFTGTTHKRVLVRFLEIWPVIGCNLKCDYCGAFSPLMSGSTPPDELCRWLETWSRKVVPLNMCISGGEPFLYQELDAVLDCIRGCWKDVRIEIVSNALMLPKVKASVWDAVRRNKVQVLVTKHFDHAPYNEKFFAGTAVLKEQKIPHSIRRSDKYWFKYYDKNEAGDPVPFRSNPCKAWKQCFAKIAVIEENELWYCGLLAHFVKTRQAGKIGAEWDAALRHKPLNADCSYNELLQYLYSGVIPECSLCAEKYEYITPGEITVKPKSP